MYHYDEERLALFSDQGQRMFLKVRDHTHKVLAKSGAITMLCAMSGDSGDAWRLMACVDRMVELGELREIPQGAGTAGQDRIFVSTRQ